MPVSPVVGLSAALAAALCLQPSLPSLPVEEPMRDPEWAYDQAWGRAPWDRDGAALRRVAQEVRAIPAPSARLDRALRSAEAAARNSRDLVRVFRWAALAERKANWQQMVEGSRTVAPAARALAGLREGRSYVEVAKLRFSIESRWFSHRKTNDGLNFVARRLFAKLPEDRSVLYDYAIRMAQSFDRRDRLSAIDAARKLTRLKPDEATCWYVLGSALRLHAGQEDSRAIAREAIEAYRTALRQPGINKPTREVAEIGIKQVHRRFPDL
jgi:tetratricopeptide (TPR) repeat protein